MGRPAERAPAGRLGHVLRSAWACHTNGSSTDKHDVQELRTPAALAAALATALIAALVTASGGGFAGNHDHAVSLFVQRAGLGTGLGLQGLFHHELCGAVLL